MRPDCQSLSRVLHVSPSYYPAVEYGGPVRTLYELCLAQVRAGLKVRVLTSTASGQDAGSDLRSLGGRWVDEFGVPTYYARARLPPDIAPAMVPMLVPLCRWAQVVHVTGLFSASSVLAMAAALASQRPLVLSPRGALLPWALGERQQGSAGPGNVRTRARKQVFIRGLAPLLRRVRGWHVTSEEEAASVRSLLAALGSLAAAPPIDIVAPGVHSSAVPAVSAQPQFLVLGRIHPVKNLELAIEALSLLRRGAVPQASLVIAGPVADPDYERKLRARIAALELGPAVRWAGLVTGAAKERLLADSAALWLCSHMESFGNVVVEALAAGTPVVATQTTPWALLAEAAVGRFVPAQPAAVAAAASELLARQRDPPTRQELASRCQQLARAHFGWEQAEQKMRQLYFRAMGCGLPALG